jgi:hypothetical protein
MHVCDHEDKVPVESQNKAISEEKKKSKSKVFYLKKVQLDTHKLFAQSAPYAHEVIFRFTNHNGAFCASSIGLDLCFDLVRSLRVIMIILR